jgi:hypothetical protein
LPEFKFLPGLTKAVTNPIGFVSDGLAKLDDGLHNVVKSPIGKLIATIGLTMVGVPPWLASAGLTAYSGGNLKDVLISGAMGYLGSGGTVMGVNPLGEIASFLPGAQGSLINNALASGTMGAGIGLLRGQSVGEALKSGALSAAQTAGMQHFGLTAPNAKPDSGTNNAPHFMQGEQVSGPISSPDGAPNIQAVSGVGSAQGRDFVTDAQITNQAPEFKPALNASYRLPTGEAAQTGGIPSPSSASAMGPTPSQLAETGGIPWSESAAAQARVSGPTAQAPTPGSVSSVGGQSIPTGTTLSTSPVGQGEVSGVGLKPPAESSLIGRAQDFAKTPSFDNFGKIFVDPTATTTFGKYAPGAALALGATALAGGFKTRKAEQNPAFNAQYTGMNYIKDHPEMFGGSLRAGQFSNMQPIGVPTTGNQMGIPMPQITLPTYNRPYATGGDVNHYPRKVGAIDGPGTATSDSIPAMLSDGEFVFTAKAVRNAGGGSRRKGAAKMYKLMKSLENGPLGSN